MARKIKFALEMADGAKVRGSIEELREHFDLEKAVGYFLSGKLVEWLEDRFYEDEAESVEAIDKDAPDLRERLCEALGVPYEGDSELDVEALERLNEKKAILRQKTGDEEIIAHAAQTAFNQEDLADLLEMGEPVIYLCGEKFNIPARVKNKKYVGILGTPSISIKATSQEELASKGIEVENVTLPWASEEKKEQVKDFLSVVESVAKQKTNNEDKTCPKCGQKNQSSAKFCNSCGASMSSSSSNETNQPTSQECAQVDDRAEKLAMMNEIFSRVLHHRDQWLFVKRGYGETQQIRDVSAAQKAMCIKLVCRNKYSVDDIVHMRMDINFSVGWALTYDSFCAGGKTGEWVIKYKDIVSVTTGVDAITIKTKNGTFSMSSEDLDSNVVGDVDAIKEFLMSASTFAKL